MTLGAVKQYVVVLLTLSTFTLHKQREDSNASPPSMNGMYGNFMELEHGQGSNYCVFLFTFVAMLKRGFTVVCIVEVSSIGGGRYLRLGGH